MQMHWHYPNIGVKKKWCGKKKKNKLMCKWDGKTHLATGILKNIERGTLWDRKHLVSGQRFPNSVKAKKLSSKLDDETQSKDTQKE